MDFYSKNNNYDCDCKNNYDNNKQFKCCVRVIQEACCYPVCWEEKHDNKVEEKRDDKHDEKQCYCGCNKRKDEYLKNDSDRDYDDQKSWNDDSRYDKDEEKKCCRPQRRCCCFFRNFHC